VKGLGGDLLSHPAAGQYHRRWRAINRGGFTTCGEEGCPVSVKLAWDARSHLQIDVGPGLLLPDYINRDLHRRNRSSVLKPVCGVPILGPAHPRPIGRSDSISMVSDRSLQDEDDAWSVFMVVHRAEDASRLDGHHPHSKLAPCHALDLRAKGNRCKYLRRNTVRLRCRRLVAHRALLSVRPGPNVRPSTQDELISDTRSSLRRRQRQPALVRRCFQEPTSPTPPHDPVGYLPVAVVSPPSAALRQLRNP